MIRDCPVRRMLVWLKRAPASEGAPARRQEREQCFRFVSVLLQEYDQAFYPRLVIVLILVLAALVGLGGFCVTHIGKPIYVSTT